MRPGQHNALTDVTGLRVGHAALDGPGALSGTTVVLAPPGGAVGGVDVRGSAPGTRETDLLDPGATVQRLHAILLTGGSAYGLAAAGGVVARLEAAGAGFEVPGGVVPIVPGAVLFDLGRGGDFAARPDAALGAAAYDDASDGPVRQGAVGAGTGAVAGGLKGGVGTASVVLDGGATVAALVVLNAVGSALDPATGVPLALRLGLPGEFPEITVDETARAVLREPRRPPEPGTATTLVVVATDVELDKAGCRRLATMGHDGLARAVSPVHTIMDGDVVFGLSTAARPAAGPPEIFALQAAAADVVSRATVHAVLAAESVGGWRGYRDVVGSSALSTRPARSPSGSSPVITSRYT
ncbi:P1 family peptidase [Pseudonocardia abyssalis]|uniref:P1 family peptidase n=1 Tax=Pseudonocardia abyssalis TaxID=2792008 RepID=A0ABS6V088_9PSEU|nr:P1 family peptidase [Pseudonocardia abyssalis]MBW0137822.1 P1 family peptidase [Pseudonocardia abyssalis]